MNDGALKARPEWKTRLEGLLPLFGHRNWIVVADAAYPAQASAGIETIVANADHWDVVSTVLSSVTRAPHVRANIYLDSELDFIGDKQAPGIGAFRTDINKALQGMPVHRLLHEQIITQLDQCARTYRILIIKTTMKLPYTTIFCELDCGYWDADSELLLRQTIQPAGQ